MARDTGCNCSSPKGLRVAADLFITASVFMLVITVIYFVYTDYSSVENIVLYYEVAMFVSSLIFLSASIYLRVRVLDYSDNYKKILMENYKYEESNVDERSYGEICFSANSYLVVGWLFLCGTLPLILIPVPIFPFIMIFLVLFILLFIVAASPRFLAMNGGRGSMFYLDKVCDAGGCCACCGSGSPGSGKYIGSDVLIMLLILGMFGVFFSVVAGYNVYKHFRNIKAWLWLLSAIFYTVGMIMWYRHSIPHYSAVAETEQPLVSSSSSADTAV